MGDFNLALVIVAVVVSVLVLLVSVYLLVNYQHPDDANQAWFPKLVVVLGITVAVLSILMLPADVANRQACKKAVYNGACSLTLPMKTLWLLVYIVDAVLVFLVIPFAMFYYEGDQDKSVGKRLKTALIWVVASAVVCGLILGILYAWQGLNFSIPPEAESLFLSALDCAVGNGKRLRFWRDPWLGGRTAQQIAPNLWNHVRRRGDKALSIEEAILNNKWVGGIRGSLSVQAVVEFLELWELVQATTLNEDEDTVRWRLTANGVYSAKSAYNASFFGRVAAPGAAEVWSAGAPLSHKLHMWLALKNRLWTADRLEKRGLQHPPHCPLCSQEPENGEHLLVQCVFAREVWFAVLQPQGLQRFTPSPTAVAALWWAQLSDSIPRKMRKEVNALITLTARSIWLERNSRVFDHVTSPTATVIERIRQEFRLWKIAGLCGESRGIG